MSNLSCPNLNTVLDNMDTDKYPALQDAASDELAGLLAYIKELQAENKALLEQLYGIPPNPC